VGSCPLRLLVEEVEAEAGGEGGAGRRHGACTRREGEGGRGQEKEEQGRVVSLGDLAAKLGTLANRTLLMRPC